MPGPPLSPGLQSILDKNRLKRPTVSIPSQEPLEKNEIPVLQPFVKAIPGGTADLASIDIQGVLDRLMTSSLKTGEGRLAWLSALSAVASVIFGIIEGDTTAIVAGLSIVAGSSAKLSHDRNNLKIEVASVLSKLLTRVI